MAIIIHRNKPITCSRVVRMKLNGLCVKGSGRTHCRSYPVAVPAKYGIQSACFYSFNRIKPPPQHYTRSIKTIRPKMHQFQLAAADDYGLVWSLMLQSDAVQTASVRSYKRMARVYGHIII